MKKKNYLIAIVVLMAFMFSIAGCGKKVETPESKTVPNNESTTVEATEIKNEDEKIVIGYSVYWLSEFATLMTEAMQKAADEAGVELLIRDAQWDPVVQLGHVDEFITKEVDAMIIAPCDAASMVQGVEAANKVGIPFVGVNMYVESDGVDAYAGPDDVRAGEMMVEYAKEQLGDTFNVIVLEGAEGYFAMLDRRKGIQNMLDSNPGITALAIKTAGWTREGALELMENYIQEFGDEIDAVVAHNDEMALGAIQALEAANMNDKVIVTGVDAIYDACVAIKDGRYNYTVFQDATLEGGLAFEKAYALVKGETLDEPETFINMIGVTSENVEEYLKMFDK